MFTPRPNAKRAFTLVEMLVVLAIIGLLMALLLPAVNAAVNSARRTAIALEIKQLDDAFETYKQQRGEYPPSFGENYAGMARYSSVVERHLQRCYPKFLDNPMVTNDNKDNFYNNIAPRIDQAEALVLWLRSMSSSVADPFQALPVFPPSYPIPANFATRNSYYEFDDKRLIDDDNDGFPTYRAKYCRDTDYIYMENRNYLTYLAQNAYARSGTGTQRTVPYAASATTGVNPTKFQIISAGLDGDFGNLPGLNGMTYKPKLFPTGAVTMINDGYGQAELDNITNFSGGKTLGDSRPQ